MFENKRSREIDDFAGPMISMAYATQRETFRFVRRNIHFAGLAWRLASRRRAGAGRTPASEGRAAASRASLPEKLRKGGSKLLKPLARATWCAGKGRAIAIGDSTESPIALGAGRYSEG